MEAGIHKANDRQVVDITTAASIAAVSRAQLYRYLSRGEIEAVKSGRRTLVVVESLHKHIRNLPLAHFRPETKRV